MNVTMPVRVLTFKGKVKDLMAYLMTITQEEWEQNIRISKYYLN